MQDQLSESSQSIALEAGIGIACGIALLSVAAAVSLVWKRKRGRKQKQTSYSCKTPEDSSQEDVSHVDTQSAGSIQSSASMITNDEHTKLAEFTPLPTFTTCDSSTDPSALGTTPQQSEQEPFMDDPEFGIEVSTAE